MTLGINQQPELLIYEYHKRNFKAISDYCLTANAFQDLPFAAPFLFIYLDQIFPNAKFILTRRDNPEQWYSSLVRFHSKKWSDGVNPPSKEELLKAGYRNQTFAYDTKHIVFNSTDEDLYHKDTLISSYESHNKQPKNISGQSPTLSRLMLVTKEIMCVSVNS